MTTPLADFLRRYAAERTVRMHMPGHKGLGSPEAEALDLTEIDGADELYHARGIIRESEENASALFGSARTLYSAEGSSLCVRAMLALALMRGREQGLPPRILAGRNAHRTLMSAAALLDADITWLYPRQGESLLSGLISPEDLAEQLRRGPWAAVYLTSPDYLGHLADLRTASCLCRQAGIPLLVDNAHGAYLKFLPEDLHPLTLGADLCCDSAHKTLSCLTGAAYLHLGKDAPALWLEQAENALALFGSTSPSYLVLRSLDVMNRRLAGDYPARLAETVRHLSRLKEQLTRRGWRTVGDEPMKLTLAPRNRGWSGTALAARLREQGIVCEFADPDYVTLMPSAETTEEDWNRTEQALDSVPVRPPLTEESPVPEPLPRAMSIREAMLAPRERIPVCEAAGRVLADACVGCPPAVPPVIAGERMNGEAVRAMEYYGISDCFAVVGGLSDRPPPPFGWKAKVLDLNVWFCRRF